MTPRPLRLPRPLAWTCALLLGAAALPATGQELEPRAYRTLPTGLNFLVLGGQYTSVGSDFDVVAAAYQYRW